MRLQITSADLALTAQLLMADINKFEDIMNLMQPLVNSTSLERYVGKLLASIVDTTSYDTY